MPIPTENARDILLADLNKEQRKAVRNESRRLLVVAGAGSGKTEVMARRVAWWVSVDNVPKERIIAFTFTDSAAEELKFRIRRSLEKIALTEDDSRLGGMYIGTIHGFCLKVLRDLAPDEFYMFDVADDVGRMSLIEQGYHGVLALKAFEDAAGCGKFRSQQLFLRGYDLLNEYDRLDVSLPPGPAPTDVSQDRDWCGRAQLNTKVGESGLARAFATSAARYYAYLRARRFLDFSTVQSEVTRRLKGDASFRNRFSMSWKRLVVDEVQDINPVQYELIKAIVGERGYLTAVGDHRQAIYSFRGGRVDLMGSLYGELNQSKNGYVQELPANYRSTPRIIELANRWSNTISETAGMENPSMKHRRCGRQDTSNHHVGQVHFDNRENEAAWIGDTISRLVPTSVERSKGAFHDEGNDSRGLTLSDIAVLVRSSTDIRTYQDALRQRGIPAVVRGGPDLFSQPEVLLFLGILSACSGLERFFGNEDNPRSMPGRVRTALGVSPVASEIIPAALAKLEERGLRIPGGTQGRLNLLCNAISHRLNSSEPQPESISSLKCDTECRRWLNRNRQPRRVFPQTIFHWLLREAGIHRWGNHANRAIAETTLFHVGQLSSLVKAIETSGWTPAKNLKWQLIALLNWGAGSARAVETPLLTSPDAVTVTTIHSAKGLEFGAVFLADVCARRFPSNRARIIANVPFDKGAEGYVDPARLSDNDNHDNERRLMYVALTRAERYLYISSSGNQKSSFFKSLGKMISDVGGIVSENNRNMRRNIRESITYEASRLSREDRLSTNFSDLRYFLECPHDFYLRKVLGFAPTIGQEFGYGRGLHNLLRVVHSSPRDWADLAADRRRLKTEIEDLIERGMFYLRYTVGNPLENLRRRAVRGVMEYVEAYADELAKLTFEPEKEFETLIEDENLLISGAIDVVRLDDPPRVSIVDFKSGDSADETGSGLNRKLMGLQIGLYALAARDELEYDPQHGLIRYIGERNPNRRQLEVDFDERQLNTVRKEIVRTGRRIRKRKYDKGPTNLVKDRCARCDFLNICSRPEARRSRRGSE